MSNLEELIESPAPFRQWLQEQQGFHITTWSKDNPMAKFLAAECDLPAAMVMFEMPAWMREFNKRVFILSLAEGYISTADCLVLLGE